jgi:hypothetical protein
VSAGVHQASTEAQRFAVLQLAGIALLVPLHEVYSLESAIDVDSTRKSGGSVGAIRNAESWFTVFCLSDNLEPISTLQATFRICAILATADAAVGLACRSVSSVDSSVLAHHPLPECMRTVHSPIQGLTRHGEHIYCRTSLHDLVPLLEQAA